MKIRLPVLKSLVETFRSSARPRRWAAGSVTLPGGWRRCEGLAQVQRAGRRRLRAARLRPRPHRAQAPRPGCGPGRRSCCCCRAWGAQAEASLWDCALGPWAAPCSAQVRPSPAPTHPATTSSPGGAPQTHIVRTPCEQPCPLRMRGWHSRGRPARPQVQVACPGQPFLGLVWGPVGTMQPSALKGPGPPLPRSQALWPWPSVPRGLPVPWSSMGCALRLRGHGTRCLPLPSSVGPGGRKVLGWTGHWLHPAKGHPLSLRSPATACG